MDYAVIFTHRGMALSAIVWHGGGMIPALQKFMEEWDHDTIISITLVNTPE